MWSASSKMYGRPNSPMRTANSAIGAELIRVISIEPICTCSMASDSSPSCAPGKTWILIRPSLCSSDQIGELLVAQCGRVVLGVGLGESEE